MTYTANGIEYDSNNLINQRILDEFCKTHIYLDMTAETNFIIHFLTAYDGSYKDKDVPFTMDDYGEAFVNAYDDDDPDADTPEIYEWYAVSERLAELLKEQHEIVIDSNDKFLWGRQSFGQAIALDYVIQKIALNREILQGQKYSWE